MLIVLLNTYYIGTNSLQETHIINSSLYVIYNLLRLNNDVKLRAFVKKIMRLLL